MPTSIRLTPEIEHRIDFLAAKTGRTKAFYLRQIIESGITDLEDYYLAAGVLERIRSGKEKTHSSDAVRKSLGLTNDLAANDLAANEP